ncbi:cadherin-like beta sandwich domain-containing protein [Paenibacillus chondroitinus]|uniref:Cadherin-like beta sandwich domain-containing protein n=1 Tax=Paenibacillus chondroitinus TaxID=59842 RepID=A0ABU6DJK6_9BACL|nr:MULTISPECIES: S-layer homology domain-containing protein [Paenibacillus]MCY9660988.1 cadherin-like beta sandwich domain-containing protein [Paenibacillus anseongense]MEB4797953.1 cadherin-like beta sandwich domain-containing protein [Paenibacillus chondroitinus]
MKKISVFLIMVAMLFVNCSFVSAAVKTGWDISAARGVAVDASGKIYVADLGNHRVQIYNSDESLYKTLGVKGVLGSDNSHFNSPRAVEVERTTGDIYVLDSTNNRVQVFDSQGNWLRTIALPPNASKTPIPEAMTLDGNGHLFVSDQNINIVYRFDLDGTNMIVVDSTGVSGRPMGLAVDDSGNLYVSQYNSQVVFKYQYNSGSGTYSKVKTIGALNASGTDNSHFNGPWGLYTDSSNRLYVTDQTNKRVQVFNSDGNYALTLSDTGFITPHDVASDSSGNVYVLDRGANKIFLFKPQESFGTALGQNIVPTFIGSITTLTVDQNSGAADITSLLHISDTDLGQIETWTASSPPSHGTLSITNVTAPSGSVDIAPGSPITYTPTAGYSGTDSFTVQVSDGVGGTVTRTISVNIRGQVATPTANPASGAAVANNSKVTLGSATSGVTIYYTTDGTTPTTGSASGTNVTISGAPGATVIVKAIAVKAGSLNSSMATFTYTIQAPAPINLTAAAGDGQATLSWTGVQGANTYSVYQGTASGNYDSIPVVTVSGVSHTVTGLTNGSNYYYAVKANYAGGSSDYSNEAIAKPKSGDANLSGLALSRGTLNPIFAPNIVSYEADVTNDVTSVTITPMVSDVGHAAVTASVYTSSGNLKDGPFTLTSGTASPAVTLDEGSNVIKVVVTAQDSTTKTYTVTVTRVGSSDANLSGLSLSSGLLSPVFASGTTNYSATVPNDVSVTTVTYHPADSHATAALRLNGASANNPVNLTVGSNIISVVVTAQDGTTKSYSVTVTRAGSNNAVLSSLNLSGITLDQPVTGNVYAYTATVPYDVSVTTATYATTESHATVALSLNGAPVINPISLQMGSNIISFAVTAQDGTVQTYTVNVTREPQRVANISVSSASETMYVGDSLQLSASVTPDNATDKTVSWSVVPSTGAATINEDGLLVATQVGMVTVQATAQDGSGIVGSKVITISNRSTSGGSHSDSHTDTQSPSAPVQTPEPAQTPDSTPKPATDVFRSNVVQGDNNVVKNIETRIQEAKKDPTIANLLDTKGHWAEKTIDIFVKLHVIEGYDDGAFKPNGNITRAEFAMILSRVFDINGGDNTSTVLKDVGSHWAQGAIERFVKAGVISGYEDGTFKPDKTITREEMVVMLSRIINLNNVAKDTSKGNFNDLEGAYATNEIKAEAQAGIISGKADGKFDPKNNATRAEALQIILNTLKLNPQLKTLLDSIN